MLIEDVEKLIKELQEEQGMSLKEARKEAFKRALEDEEESFEIERGYDRPLGGLPAPKFEEQEDEPELEGDICWDEDDEDDKTSKTRGFFGRFFGKSNKPTDDDLSF